MFRCVFMGKNTEAPGKWWDKNLIFTILTNLKIKVGRGVRMEPLEVWLFLQNNRPTMSNLDLGFDAHFKHNRFKTENKKSHSPLHVIFIIENLIGNDDLRWWLWRYSKSSGMDMWPQDGCLQSHRYHQRVPETSHDFVRYIPHCTVFWSDWLEGGSIGAEWLNRGRGTVSHSFHLESIFDPDPPQPSGTCNHPP